MGWCDLPTAGGVIHSGTSFCGDDGERIEEEKEESRFGEIFRLRSGMTEIGCGVSKPVPASPARSCPRSFRSASVARFGQDDTKKVRAVWPWYLRDNLTPGPFPCGKGDNRVQ